MKTKTVIKNIPTRFPLFQTILTFFLLDYYQVEMLWWGIFGTLWALLWIGCIINRFREEPIDLDEIITNGKQAKTFQEKLNEKMNSK